MKKYCLHLFLLLRSKYCSLYTNEISPIPVHKQIISALESKEIRPFSAKFHNHCFDIHIQGSSCVLLSHTVLVP